MRAFLRAVEATTSCADKLKRAHQRAEYLHRSCITCTHVETLMRGEEAARIRKAWDLVEQAHAILSGPMPEHIASQLRSQS